MKKVLMEELPLRASIKTIPEFLKENLAENAEDFLSTEKYGLKSAKLICSLIFHEALCEYGQDLKHEQQLEEALADIFIEIYTIESTIARAEKAQSIIETSKISKIIAKIFTSESLLRIKSLANISINKIFNELTLSNHKSSIQKLESRITLKTDTISLKQELADFMLNQKAYPF
tara:strand:- start:885 stop:1409 length:525 start_codon:yes stop_codon:yes gene_type:complete